MNIMVIIVIIIMNNIPGLRRLKLPGIPSKSYQIKSNEALLSSYQMREHFSTIQKPDQRFNF